MGDVYFNNFWAMGTRCDIVLPDMKTTAADFLCRKLYDEIIRLENKLSHFMSVSDVACINKYAGARQVMVDDELFSLLKLSVHYSEMTAGWFDITILPIVELYQRDKTRAQPDQQEIEAALINTGYHHILLDEKIPGISFVQTGMKIDFSGIGKGYALEKVKNILIGHDVENAFVSFGESSILTMGRHPYGESWRIGIQHVYSPGVSIHTLELKNKSLSTSGMRSLQKLKKPINRFHIINPKNGKLIKDQKTVTVISSSAIEAEVLSTALVASDVEHRKRILNNYPDCEAIEITYQQDESVDISILQ